MSDSQPNAVLEPGDVDYLSTIGQSRAVLYADNTPYMTVQQSLDAYMRSMISLKEAQEMTSRAMRKLREESEMPSVSTPIDFTKPPEEIRKPVMDTLPIRLRLERIPFTEAIKLMGLREALRYQFQRSR